MLVLWMRGYEVMFKAEGGCDPVNVGEGAVMVVNTQSMIALFNAEWRNQAVYIFGEGYMVMIFSFLLKGYGKTLFLPYDPMDMTETHLFRCFKGIPGAVTDSSTCLIVLVGSQETRVQPIYTLMACAETIQQENLKL
ncbi:hypothetical protein V6N11_040461 [Hibiscus sabdariffa]|uniref:Uncharacterized protein n=1 Tax=Hibiscus sabdariffa TaxID=183260 RepID=A0ABR2RHL2_9ROSI